ncbi:MAG: sulfotransferase family 2 domain-containing protein [Pseudomonadota bacterium]
MTAVIEAHKLVYFSIPKVASTSLKELFFHVMTGKPFEHDGRGVHYEAFKTEAFYRHDHAAYAEYTRIAVVRDPIKRILSCYTNRVLQTGRLSPDQIDMVAAERLGVTADPGIRKFILNLDKYRALSNSIRNHSQPTAYFLGPDLGYFHRVFPIEALGDMVAFLEERTGMALTLSREMTSEKKIEFDDLTPTCQDRLREYCAADYAYLKDYYRPR